MTAEEILDGLISKWFITMKNNEINKEFLFVVDMDDVLKEKLASNDSFKNKYQILDVSSYFENNKWMRGSKNIILYCPKEALKNDFSGKCIKEKILFVRREYFSNSMVEKLSSRYKNSSTGIVNELEYQYYVEKLEPFTVIYDINLKNFIEYRLRYIRSIYNYRNFLSLLLKKIDYDEDNYLSIIDEDTIFFNDNKILRSRLAVLIYRIATLKLNANITEAGRYFSMELGIKSKTYNIELLKKLKNIQTLPFYTAGSIHNLKKNFKAYDLNYKESEDKIRKEITKRLVDFMEKDDVLNIENISKITKFSRDEIRKLTLKGI